MSIKFESPLIWVLSSTPDDTSRGKPPKHPTSNSEPQARQEVHSIFFRCTYPGIVPRLEAQIVEVHRAFGATTKFQRIPLQMWQS